MKLKFVDAPYMSAGQKKHVYCAWDRFVDAIARGESGDALLKRFTQPLYHHLTQHCSFIAHYDRFGFFGTYFEEPEDTIRFFTQFDPDGLMRSIEYGDSWWVSGGNGTQEPYQDLNQAMCEATRMYLPSIRTLATTRQKAMDMARANALLAKHGQPTV